MWLAYFNIYQNIHQNEDFYFERYEGLNDSYVLFKDKKSAWDAIMNHIKLAIDTISSKSHTEDWVNYIRDWLRIRYNDISQWNPDEVKYPEMDIWDNIGNYELHYFIKEIKFFDDIVVGGDNNDNN